MGFKGATSRTLSMVIWVDRPYHSEQGDIYYDETTIFDKLKNYINNPEIEHSICLHDRCLNIDGKPVDPHYHIKMRRTDGKTLKHDVLQNKFPCCDFQSINGEEDITGENDEPSGWQPSLAYLLHRGFEGKTQYTYDDLITNIPRDVYEDLVNDYVSKHAKQTEAYIARQKRKEEASKARHQILLNDLARKQHDLELEQLFLNIQDDILDGKLTPRGYNKMIKETADGLYREMNAKYSAKIKKAFDTYYNWKKENCLYRDLTVWVIEGNGGKGKTLLAQHICEANGLLYSISSEERDPFATVKCDDDVFICNDFRDNTLKYQVFLHTMEPHLVSETGSRFYNKAFWGKLIIITTPKSINEWYLDYGKNADKKAIADGTYNGKSTLCQFHRRIQRVIKIEGDKEEYYSVYDHHEDGTDTFVARYHNPVALLSDTEKKKHEYLLDDQFLARAIRKEAETLGVLEKYDELTTTVSVPSEKEFQAYLKQQSIYKKDKSIDVTFVLNQLLEDAVNQNIPKDILLQVLYDKINGTQSW